MGDSDTMLGRQPQDGVIGDTLLIFFAPLQGHRGGMRLQGEAGLVLALQSHHQSRCPIPTPTAAREADYEARYKGDTDALMQRYKGRVITSVPQICRPRRNASGICGIQPQQGHHGLKRSVVKERLYMQSSHIWVRWKSSYTAMVMTPLRAGLPIHPSRSWAAHAEILNIT